MPLPTPQSLTEVLRATLSRGLLRQFSRKKSDYLRTQTKSAGQYHRA
jgi:hypothetical protein